jgi:hypothetical protein
MKEQEKKMNQSEEEYQGVSFYLLKLLTSMRGRNERGDERLFMVYFTGPVAHYRERRMIEC